MGAAGRIRDQAILPNELRPDHPLRVLTGIFQNAEFALVGDNCRREPVDGSICIRLQEDHEKLGLVEKPDAVVSTT
jgi:hypothetical protein